MYPGSTRKVKASWFPHPPRTALGAKESRKLGGEVVWSGRDRSAESLDMADGWAWSGALITARRGKRLRKKMRIKRNAGCS